MRSGQRQLIKNILKWAGFCFVIGVVATRALVKIWLGPAYVAAETGYALSQFWSGPVRVGDVDFNFDGVMFLSKVVFYESNGTEHIRADRIKLVLGKWPSLTAHARRIEVERVSMKFRLEDGRPVIPLRLEPSCDTEQEYPEYFKIKQADVSVDSNGTKVVFDGLLAEVTKNKDLYKLNIADNGKKDGKFQIEGVFDLKSGRPDVNIKFIGTARREEMKMLLLAIGVSQTWDCEGKVDATLKVQGDISDFESLLPRGKVNFHNWTILSNKKIAVEEVNGVLIVDGHHLKLTKCYGRLCDGNFHCSLDVNINMSAPVAFLGDLLITDVNMVKLTELLLGNRKFAKGTGFLSMRFTVDTSGIGSLNGNGILMINDADLWKIPIIGELFKRIGNGEYQFASLSDTEVVFGLSASQMTIERGRMSNRLSAIEAEPGGKINLQNGQVDIYVMALPIKQINKLLVEVPVMNWFANFQNRVLRLRLKGRWSQPPGELISKQPLKDLKDGTVGFFIDVVQSGGQLIKKTQKGQDF